MREILFRGKRIDNGEWVEGYYCKHNTVKVCLSTDDPKTKHLIVKDGFCDWGLEPPLHGYEVDPETVGQYTGLRDSKRTTEYPEGQRIFEGDIVRHHNGYSDSEIKEIGVVFWCEEYCGWRRTSNGKFHHGVVDTYRLSPDCVYEVIGNIHDNKLEDFTDGN